MLDNNKLIIFIQDIFFPFFLQVYVYVAKILIRRKHWSVLQFLVKENKDTKLLRYKFTVNN